MELSIALTVVDKATGQELATQVIRQDKLAEYINFIQDMTNWKIASACVVNKYGMKVGE